jgi:hypothetical protein
MKILSDRMSEDIIKPSNEWINIVLFEGILAKYHDGVYFCYFILFIINISYQYSIKL